MVIVNTKTFEIQHIPIHLNKKCLFASVYFFRGVNVTKMKGAASTYNNSGNEGLPVTSLPEIVPL